MRPTWLRDSWRDGDDFSHEHDSTVQETLLKACGLSLKD